MKTNKSIKYILPCMTVLAIAMAQAHAADSMGITVSGEITPKLYYFNYTGGPGAGLTPYLQSYSGQKSWTGDRDDGFYADIDLSLILSGEQGDILTLERQGFGLDNHRGSLKGGNQSIGFKGYYSHYRSNTGGVDYVNRPGTVDNPVDTSYNAAGTTGYMTKFSDDGLPQTNYHTERTAYGVGVKFKPDLLGKGTSLAINVDGYKRDGNKFATWVAGGSDFANGAGSRHPERWRGYDKPIDEKMSRISLNFTAAPAGLFQFAYDGSYEKFDNQARTFVMGDFASFLDNGVTVNNTTKPVQFIPDSILMSHAIRLSKTFGDTAVAAGYGISRLEQDSFSGVQIAAGYTTGKISTENAFLNVNHRVSSTMGLEGHIKYLNRDNDSTYPAPGLINGAGTTEQLGVRINNVESLNYGLSASFRGLPVKSTLSVGWKREDSDRDLTFNSVGGIIAPVSLYREETVSDEVYLKWVARPMQGMTLRVTPSYVWADKTAFVTLPEESLNLKTSLGYALEDGMYLNAYYNYKDKENGNNSSYDLFAKTVTTATLSTENPQKADDTFHSAGVSLNLAPSEQLNASVSLDWTQNDFETYYFSTERRRFELPVPAIVPAIDFYQRGDSSFKVDTWSLSLNGEYQASERLKLSAGYTLSVSDGDVSTATSGLATPANITVTDKIDNTLQSFILGANYGLKKNMTLRGGYTYDKYDDNAYDALSGGVHTLMAGVSFAL